MIARVPGAQALPFFESDPFSQAEPLALLRAFSQETPFFDVYASETGAGVLAGDTLYLSRQAADEEWAELARWLSPKRIFGLSSPLSGYRARPIYRIRFSRPLPHPKGREAGGRELPQVYGILSSVFPGLPSFADFRQNQILSRFYLGGKVLWVGRGVQGTMARLCSVDGVDKLDSLAVSPAARGKGLGRALVAALVNEALRAGRQPVLDCEEDRKTYYLALGGEIFQKTEVQQHELFSENS